MKIADLFIALGFKVEGPNTLATVDRQINSAQSSAVKLLVAVSAVNAAFLVMMDRAVNAAVGLDMFERATGISGRSLQQWQAMAAKSNVAGKSVTGALEAIRHAQAEIALGNVDASSPWFLLGIDPREDPLKVMGKLKDAIKGLDPAIAGDLLGKMGFGPDVLYLLQQNKTLGSLFVSDKDIGRLTQLGGAWKNLLFNLNTVATKFSATFAEGLERVVNFLSKGVVLMDAFVTWLNSGSIAANSVRAGLLLLVATLFALGGALGLVVTALGAIQLVLMAIQAIPIVLAFTALVTVVLALAAGIAFLGLLFEDFWTQIDGGQSLFDWNENLLLTVKNVERLAKAIEWVADNWSKVNALGTLLVNPSGFVLDRQVENYLDSKTQRGGQSGPVHQENKVDIHVHGGDPVATGREVGKSVRREISDAYGMMPIPTN